MNDAELAAALADDVVRNERTWSRNGYRIPEAEVDLIVRALRRLAEQSAPSPTPADLREVVGLTIAAHAEFCVSSSNEIGIANLDRVTDAGLSVISAAGYMILPREPTEAMIEAGATAKLNYERAVSGLMPVALSDLEADDADIYRMDASIVLRAAIAAKEPAP